MPCTRYSALAQGVLTEIAEERATAHQARGALWLTATEVRGWAGDTTIRCQIKYGFCGGFRRSEK